jgi:hypothetical protein
MFIRTLVVVGLGLALASGCARKTQVAATPGGDGPTGESTGKTTPAIPPSNKVANPGSNKERLVGEWRLGTAGSSSERVYDFRPDGNVLCSVAGTPFLLAPEQQGDRYYRAEYRVTAEDGRKATVVFNVVDLGTRKRAEVTTTAEFTGDDKVRFTHQGKPGDLGLAAMPDRADLARK